MSGKTIVITTINDVRLLLPEMPIIGPRNREEMPIIGGWNWELGIGVSNWEVQLFCFPSLVLQLWIQHIWWAFVFYLHVKPWHIWNIRSSVVLITLIPFSDSFLSQAGLPMFKLGNLDHLVHQLLCTDTDPQGTLLVWCFGCFLFCSLLASFLFWPTHLLSSWLKAVGFSSIECVFRLLPLVKAVVGNLQEWGQEKVEALVENEPFGVPNPKDHLPW